MDIIGILARALGTSEKELFKRASLVHGEAMYQAYCNYREIPSPVLNYCKTIEVCVKCGANLSGTTARIIGTKDGVTLRTCLGECTPKEGPVAAREPTRITPPPDEPPIRVSVMQPHEPPVLPHSPPLALKRRRKQAFRDDSFDEPPATNEIEKRWEEEIS